MPNLAHLASAFLGLFQGLMTAARDVPFERNKIMKRANSIFAACVAVIGFTAFANPLPDGKNYTEKVGDYTWTFSVENGEATIERLATDGAGSYWGMGERAVDPIPRGALVIPETLGGCSVVSVGFHALGECEAMTSLALPQTLVSIGGYAFQNCSSLTQVGVPASVESICEGAFESCSSLTQIAIPASVESIGEGAFWYCSQLRNLTVDAGNQFYSSDDGVLYDKSKETIYFWPQQKLIEIPEGVRDIRPYVFYGNYATQGQAVCLTFPNSVTNVGMYAFQSCCLQSVDLNDGLISIGYGAFQWNSELRSIVIPSTVRSLGSDVFYGCYELTSVFFAGDAPDTWSLYNGASADLTTYVRSGSTGWKESGSAELPSMWPLFYVQDAEYGERPIREWTTYPDVGWMVRFDLGEGAVRTGGGELEQMVRDGQAAVAPELAVKPDYEFIGWDKPFDSVSNSMSVAAIYKKNGKLLDGKNYAEKVGDYMWTFSVENGEATIVHLGRNTDGSYYEDGQRAVEPNPQGTLEIPSILGGCPVAGLGYEAINNGGMTSVVLPDSIRNVGRYALAYCYSLNDISIGNAVTNIGAAAFENCSFSVIDLPSGLASVGEAAFWNCYNLEQVLIPASLRSIGEGAFRCCSQLRSLTVDADNLYYKSDDGVLYDKGGETIFFWPQQKVIEIPEGVRDIRAYAFSNNYASQNGTVILPSTVTNIGQYAFQSCYLREVGLNEGLVSIGYGAFEYNSNLRSIVIPSTVRKIDGYAFSGCSQLLSVFFIGNAPDEVSTSLYGSTSDGLITFVRPDGTGWKTAGGAELPEEWPTRDQWGNGYPRPIREWTTYPDVGWLVRFDIGEGAIRSGGGELEQMVRDGDPAVEPTMSPDSLTVTANPLHFGTPAPGYGSRQGLHPGDAFACTVTATEPPAASKAISDLFTVSETMRLPQSDSL